MNFDEYKPGKLHLGDDTAFAEKAWEFLTTDKIVASMKTASDLGTPAVAAIREQLVSAFGDDLLIDRRRQRIGHEIRQVLEHHGYELDQEDVKVFAFPFTKAARYRRKDGVQIYGFRDSANPRQVALVATRGGDALPPPEGRKWNFWTTITSKLQLALCVQGVAPNLILEAVEHDGYWKGEQARILRAAS